MDVMTTHFSAFYRFRDFTGLIYWKGRGGEYLELLEEFLEFLLIQGTASVVVELTKKDEKAWWSSATNCKTGGMKQVRRLPTRMTAAAFIYPRGPTAPNTSWPTASNFFSHRTGRKACWT